MYAMVRTYSGGAKQLFDALEARKAEVEAAVRSVGGLVSYTMMRTPDGGVTVTVCQDKAGVDASLQVSRDWMQKNLPGISVGAPAVSEGAVVVQIK